VLSTIRLLEVYRVAIENGTIGKDQMLALWEIAREGVKAYNSSRCEVDESGRVTEFSRIRWSGSSRMWRLLQRAYKQLSESEQAIVDARRARNGW